MTMLVMAANLLAASRLVSKRQLAAVVRVEENHRVLVEAAAPIYSGIITSIHIGPCVSNHIEY